MMISQSLMLSSIVSDHCGTQRIVQNKVEIELLDLRVFTATNINDSTQIISGQVSSVSATNTASTYGRNVKNLASCNVNAALGKQVTSVNDDETLDKQSNTNLKNKAKKEDSTNKKSSLSLTTTTTTAQTSAKNDDLSKWGVKALSSLKVSVDGEYFIQVLVSL